MRRKLARGFAVVLLLAATALAVWIPNRPRPEQHEPMNIILVMVDTLRADHLGSYGYDRETTPNLDRFAAKAAVFEQAYSHAPWTMPSVASVFTSLPPRDHGIFNWRQPLPVKHLTVTEHLRDHGFHTEGYVSHVIFHPRYNYDQGFIEYNDEALRKGDPHDVTTAREVTDLFLASLDDGIPEPFFVWLHYFDPHGDYLRRGEYNFGRRDIDRYDSEIRFTDEQIGRVFDALTKRGLWSNTAVVFIADHGEEFRDHGGRYHTDTLYDELIRVPLIVRVPGGQPQRIKRIVTESDVAPTLCALAGLPIPEAFTGKAFPFEGHRFNVTEDRVAFAETRHLANKRSVRAGRWKYIRDLEKNREYLFDMDSDPRERRNLASNDHEQIEALRHMLDDYFAVEGEAAEEAEMDEELREQLQALGYM